MPGQREETPELEKQTLLGNKASALQIVSALRRYRHACNELLNGRYRDGACDGVAIYNFEEALEEIEEDIDNHEA